MLPQAVSEHYRAQQRLIVSTLALTRREWSAMDPGDLEASWAKVGPRVNLLTTAGQLGAARNGAGYIAATLDEFGEDLTPAGMVNPRAFAGIASDGRPLDTLLDGALYRAKGMSLESGGKWLDMAVHTQIADASRASAATAIASYDDVGWVRMVNPPCCGPCAVLSGKEFRYNQGFERHPRCDCVHIPSTLRNPADNMGVDPSLDMITDLTDAERKALEEGADLPQVINSRRGRSRDKMSTTEGTARDRSRRRLTPDGIFAQAKSRDEALALLRQNGYLSEYGRVIAAPTRGAAREMTARHAAELAVLRAREAEPALTKLTSGLAERFGGRMEGLDFRLKTTGSLERKITSEVAEVAEKGGDLTPVEAAAKMFDVNRYTTVYPQTRYAEAVQDSLDALRADGYTLKVKNYWNVDDNPYQGVNVQITSRTGEKFELQFHTDISLEIKEGELHTLYELFRVETDDAVRASLERQMFQAAAKIPVPPGISAVA